MAELLPCPFCGRVMQNIQFHRVKFMKPEIRVIVCMGCGAMMSADMNTLDEPSEAELLDYIIEKWNTRTPKERGGDK